MTGDYPLKNTLLRERTAKDIDDQVSKILRGLGYPEPPLSLDDVRELLRLDLGYYSSTEDGFLREVAHRLRVAGMQVLARPALLGEAVRKWSLRALYLPDRKRILIDRDLPKPKQRWGEAHEVGHSIIPWHEGTMWGDNKQTLTPACHQQIENEANYAAGRLLFFQDAFVKDARDLSVGIDAITTLKEKYGNTITTTLWRYVEHGQIPLVACISCHPHRLPNDFNPSDPLKYFVGSPGFLAQFSTVRALDIFETICGYCFDRRGGPLGADDVVLTDDSGDKHVFHFETFFNHYDALTLGAYKRQHSLVIVG
jgi:uncharacterized protein DUF955